MKQGLQFSSSSEFEIVRNIKETCSYVSLNPLKEDKDYYGFSDASGPANDVSNEYVLPDGVVIKVSTTPKNNIILYL